MLRTNLMSALFAAVATGAVLMGYNAFVQNNSTQDKSATGRLSTYLNLDKAVQESKEDENKVVGTDNGSTTTSQPNVAVTETPSPDTAQSSTAMPKDESSVMPKETNPVVTTMSQTGKAESVYTVKDGDTYGCIAEKYYGSFEHFMDIMSANPVADNGFGEYSLFVGAKLTLPAIAKENLKPASSLCQ